jgi:hypothetical protein
MSAPAARTAAVSTGERSRPPLTQALASLYVGAAAAVVLVVFFLFIPTSPSENTDFQSAADFWLTANGIPLALSLLTLLAALRTLQGRRDGRLGATGMVVAGVGIAALLAIFVYDLFTATSSSFGPTYVLASAATDIGVLLFAIGSWRAGLVPRWLLVVWPITWIIGSMLPFWGPGPLLLAAAYVAMAITLPGRVRAE